MTGTGPAAYSAVMRNNAPDYDLSVIISNDPTYGGAGGIPALVSLDPDASDVVAHELFGHSFAHLGDEYADPYPGYPNVEEPNTTTNGDPATVKWAQWEKIDTATLTGNPDQVAVPPSKAPTITRRDGIARPPFARCPRMELHSARFVAKPLFVRFTAKPNPSMLSRHPPVMPMRAEATGI